MLRMKLGVGWGGVGVGWGAVGMITFFALAHMVGATQHHFPCACTHGWCYATSCFSHLHTWSVVRNIMFLALAHMVGATQHHVSCTCTHGRLYATSCFLHLHTWSVVRNIMSLALAHMVRNIMFLALAHMVGATHHASTAVPQNEMHVWLGVSHRCFQKAFVATLTHVLQEKTLTVRLIGPQIHCK